MLLLVSTSDKIQVVTSSTANTDTQASYVDYASGTITPGRLNKAIITATTTDVVAAPGASTQRNVKHLSVRNKHASTSQDVTVQHTDGTTTVELFKCTLAAGEQVIFNDGSGFQVFDSAGARKILSAFDSTPMTSFSPTISSSTGTITTVGAVTAAYKNIGKLTFVRYSIKITTNGTGAGFLRATLPVNGLAATDQPGFTGREQFNTGKHLLGLINYSDFSDVTRVVMRYSADNTYPGADANLLTLAGWYEAA